MGRSCRRVILLLAVVLFFAYSTNALADDPEPLSLSVSSARETCTLGSVTTLDYTIDGGVPPYRVTVDGRNIGQSSSPDYVPCRPSAFWSPLEEIGGDSTQRINVRATDSSGGRAYAIAELRLVPPLPAPRYLKVNSGADALSAAHLSAEWRIPYLPPKERTGEVAIRWRVKGTSEWTLEHHVGERVPLFLYRASWKVESPPSGEQREIQVAQIRHVHDLQATEVLAWSPTALVTTAAHPHELQAEATHDAITLSWGPHAPGLAYVATLRAIQPGYYGVAKRLRVTSGPLFQARFVDLLPGTLYRVEVFLDDENGWGYRLDQHRFEIRTEPAPAGWLSPSRLATHIRAFISDSHIEVAWTPPETGSRHDTLVCAHAPEDRWLGSCVGVALGEAHARVPLDWWATGGTFTIKVETGTAPAGVVEVDLHIPSYDPDLPTRGAPPEAPRFFKVSSSHLHLENPKPASWRLQWNHQDADLAEVTWQEDGRQIIRETRRSEFSIYLAHGQAPEAVRIRLLKENALTPWSAEADVASTNDSYRSVRMIERDEVVEVHWEAPADDSDVVGYRLYVSRNYGAEEVIDVGRQVSAEIAFEQTDEVLGVNVGTLYEGPLEVIHFFHHSHILRQQPQPFELGMTAEHSPCPPSKQATLIARWWISGGAPPFIVWFGERLGFKTDERRGSTEVDCQTGPDGTFQEIPAQAIDARGQTAVGALGRYSFRYALPPPDVDPLVVHFGPRSVHRDHVLLSWNCRYWPFETVLRWRAVGEVNWTYTADFPQHRDRDNLCRGTWDGLQPLTTYEYQLARFEQSSQLRDPEGLQWSELEAVTMLGPPQGLSIVQEGETVKVKWLRQPESWAYLVGLRAEGRSWWKHYEPSGEPTETVYFYRIPQALSLSLDLVSPPLEYGAESRLDGYDIHPSYFHE